MTAQKSPNRRQFLKRTAAALAAPTIVPASALGLGSQPAPGERVVMGYIGLGNRGFGVMEAFLKHADVQGVAVCDVHDLHYRDREWGKGRVLGREPGKSAVEQAYAAQKRSGSWKGCEAYADYRELLAREDIDAVMVSTPDHWHALVTLEALQSGKDVYCEKPVTHWFAEGQRVYREAARRNAIFQVGCQHRSEDVFRKAVEIVRNGHLGKLTHVEVGLPTGYPEPMGDPTPAKPPKGLDFELWTGPAQIMPYMRARHHRWWRGHLNYGGGNVQDFIPHYNDIAHWGLDQEYGGPIRVEAKNWTESETEIYNTPVNYEIHCEYPGGVRSLVSSKVAAGVKWVGEDGWLHVGIKKLTGSNPAWLKQDFDPGSWKVTTHSGHQRNFTDGVKTRTPCVAPSEIGHRAITPGYLGYVSNKLGRPLAWDAKTETISDDADAQKMLTALNYRDPWKLPG